MKPTLLLFQILVHTHMFLLQNSQLTPAHHNALQCLVFFTFFLLSHPPEFYIAFCFSLEVDLVAGLHLQDLLVGVLLCLLQHLFHRLHLISENIWYKKVSDTVSNIFGIKKVSDSVSEKIIKKILICLF